MARSKVRRIDWSPDEWLSGTRGALTMTELAVYDVVLNTIYSRGGSAPNDAEFVFGHFKPAYHSNHHLTKAGERRMVSAALARLVELGKLRLTPDGQWLTNGRADVELGKAGERIVGAARAGVASGAARRAKRLAPISPRPPRQLPESSRETTAPSNNSNGLARTSVRNHQPPISSSSSDTESDAARASRPATEGPPARAPASKRKPAYDDELAELAAQHRARFMKGRSS